jgi:hypothetical protein
MLQVWGFGIIIVFEIVGNVNAPTLYACQLVLLMLTLGYGHIIKFSSFGYGPCN